MGIIIRQTSTSQTLAPGSDLKLYLHTLRLPPTMSTASRIITLTVTSDVVWYANFIFILVRGSYFSILRVESPWCYVATLEIRKAIARAYTNRLPVLFHIEYKPFEYNAVVSKMSEEMQKGFNQR